MGIRFRRGGGADAARMQASALMFALRLLFMGLRHRRGGGALSGMRLASAIAAASIGIVAPRGAVAAFAIALALAIVVAAPRTFAGTAAFTASGASGAAGAFAQTEALSVSGRIVNRTPGASGGVDGIPVSLHMQSDDAYETIDAVTDADGGFRFDGAAREPGVIYAVSLRYQGALYGQEVDVGVDGGSPPPLTIDVYDAVFEQSALRVDSASVLFAGADKATQTISAMEIVKIVNDSGRTFVPGNQGPMSLLRFGLPPNSEGLQVDTRLLGADIAQVDRGFAVIGSVPPGSHDIMFTYNFPYDRAETTVTKSFPFGAESLRALSPDEAMELAAGDGLGETQRVDIGARPYQLIEAAGIARGGSVSLELSGLPRPSAADRLRAAYGGVRYEYAPAAALALFLCALVVFAVARRRRRPA